MGPEATNMRKYKPKGEGETDFRDRLEWDRFEAEENRDLIGKTRDIK